MGLIALASAAVGVPAGVRAQGSGELPAVRQAAMMARVLAYNRGINSRGGAAVVVAVIYRNGSGESEARRAAIVGALRDVFANATLAGVPVKVVSIPFSEPDLESRLDAAGAAAAYVCPGLDDAVPIISRTSRRLSVLTVTSIEPQVRVGLSIGLVTRGARPMVLVNMPAARAEGAQLDAGLLGVAEVIR